MIYSCVCYYLQSLKVHRREILHPFFWHNLMSVRPMVNSVACFENIHGRGPRYQRFYVTLRCPGRRRVRSSVVQVGAERGRLLSGSSRIDDWIFSENLPSNRATRNRRQKSPGSMWNKVAHCPGRGGVRLSVVRVDAE